jgi:rare lipoprotein A
MKIPLLIWLMSCVCINAFSLETGIASWYGGKFHGRKTSSGEVYDMYKLTAAHKTLPFGTMVLVTNLENNMSVTVKVNDRGPFVKGRIIDLSKAAAMEINLVKTGVTQVKVEILGASYKDRSALVYDIQIGAFREASNANNLKNKLGALGVECVLENANNGIIRVMIKNVVNSRLDEVLSTLVRAGIASPIVRNKT